MTSKTWFLPPDFTFLPDGQIALGRIIPDPRRPTATLASLADHPAITMPELRSVVEKNRSYSAEKSRSFGLGLTAGLLDFAKTSAKTDVSWHKSKSFGVADHEVRTYNGAIAPESLKAIVALDEVKSHIGGGRFGKRCVYLISGLRVALQSFTVTDEKGNETAASLEGSAPVPAGGVPVELGGSISGRRGDKRTVGYETADGIVFAYRLHVIRPKDTSAQSELFSDRTAFFSGEADNEEAEEMEVVGVDEKILQQDLDAEPGDYDVKEVEEIGDETYVVFGSTGGEEEPVPT